MPIRPIFRQAMNIKRQTTSSGVIPKNRALQTVDQALTSLQNRINNLLLQNSSTLPSDERIQSELAECESFAKSISASSNTLKTPVAAHNSSASTLLSLESGSPRERITQSPSSASGHSHSSPPPLTTTPSFVLNPSTKYRIARQVSKLADSIITDPKVFLTPGMLSKYVRAQILLGSPAKIPQAFDLYASKPIPRSRRNKIEFKTPNPARPSSAISLPLANMALDAAIAAKDLSLCFDIIDTTVATDAFRRAKLLRRSILPLSAFVMTPPAAYIVASEFALLQNTVDVATFTNEVFVGILAYLGFSATIGYVAITTANDQMDRITWAIGTPLRERWLREEERALIDRVAGAWGFKDKHRRGEEEGYVWEALREWVGLRGMVLDRPNLMEGME